MDIDFKSKEPFVCSVTPRLAKDWLQRNLHNRKLDARIVEYYARVMKSGEWKWNGDPIRFSSTGVLLDGQHRLQACVEADMSIRATVIAGLGDDAYKTIDHGRARRLTDSLYVEKEVNCCALSGILSLIHDYRSGRMNGGKGIPGSRPADEELLDILRANPNVRNCVLTAKSNRVSSKLLGSMSSVGFLWFAFSEKDSRLATEFMTEFNEGGSPKGKPVTILRNYLTTHNSGHTRIHRRAALAIAIKAWNATRSGKGIAQLKWVPESGEDFPTIE